MYQIERTTYGIKLQFGGILEVPELQAWLRDSTDILKTVADPFSVLVDMRTLGPLDSDGKILMMSGQQMYRAKGMDRSVVILENPVTLMQFKRIAHESGIFEWERYISALDTPDWEEVALQWLVKGVDPEERLSRLSTAR